MKDNKVFSFLFEYEKKVFIILFAVFLLGFVCGSYSLFIKSDISYTTDVFSLQAANLFKKMLFSNFWLFVITFLSGYNVIAFPFMFILILYNGINIGVTISSFTYFYGLKGALIYSCLLLPFIIILILSHYFITFSSLRLSASLYNVFKEGTRYISPKVYSRPHIIKFVFYFILTSISLALYCFIFMPIVFKIL